MSEPVDVEALAREAAKTWFHMQGPRPNDCESEYCACRGLARINLNVLEPVIRQLEQERDEARDECDRYRMSPTADGGFRFQWRDRAIAAEAELAALRAELKSHKKMLAAVLNTDNARRAAEAVARIRSTVLLKCDCADTPPTMPTCRGEHLPACSIFSSAPPAPPSPPVAPSGQEQAWKRARVVEGPDFKAAVGIWRERAVAAEDLSRRAVADQRKLFEELRAAEARIKVLEAALHTYGVHLDECALRGAQPEAEECTCGLSALTPAPPPVAETPEPMVLRCPKCNRQHVDEGEWATRLHKTHLCHYCQNEWRPFERPTVGVRSVEQVMAEHLGRPAPAPTSQQGTEASKCRECGSELFCNPKRPLILFCIAYGCRLRMSSVEARAAHAEPAANPGGERGEGKA